MPSIIIEAPYVLIIIILTFILVFIGFYLRSVR